MIMQDARIEIFRSFALIITFTYIITEETKNNIIATKTLMYLQHPRLANQLGNLVRFS